MARNFSVIMFIKIDEVAQLYSALGDELARQSINQLFTRVQSIIELLEGELIKTMDEGLMCRFSTADDAVKASTLIQASSGTVEQDGHPGFRLRIGVHQGDVLEEKNDVFGDTVNVAARLQDTARSRQTIISSDVAEQLSAETRSRVRQIDLTRLKGKQEEVALFEVNWEQTEEITAQVPSLLSLGKVRSRLILTFGDDEFIMTEQKKSMLIGRGATCDLVVNTRLASREHASIEIRRGKFVIKDQGSNGTYVRTSSGQPVFLRREEFVLPDEGYISLGESFAKAPDTDLVHFKTS